MTKAYGASKRHSHALPLVSTRFQANEHRGQTTMRAQGATKMQGGGLDFLSWPVAVVSLSILPWLHELWMHFPTATAIYTSISAGFMVFQMCDKLGWLDRFKRKEPPQTRSKTDDT